jgi:hypothetical protein
VVDGDLVTARTGHHCNLFTRKIIEQKTGNACITKGEGNPIAEE